MNKIEWLGVVGVLIVLVIMLSGCAGYEIVYERGEAYDPVVLAKQIQY